MLISMQGSLRAFYFYNYSSHLNSGGLAGFFNHHLIKDMIFEKGSKKEKTSYTVIAIKPVQHNYKMKNQRCEPSAGT